MTLHSLIEHMAWADARAHRQLDAMPDGSAEKARAESIFAHLAAAEHVWFARHSWAAVPSTPYGPT